MYEEQVLDSVRCDTEQEGLEDNDPTSKLPYASSSPLLSTFSPKCTAEVVDPKRVGVDEARYFFGVDGVVRLLTIPESLALTYLFIG